MSDAVKLGSLWKTKKEGSEITASGRLDGTFATALGLEGFSVLIKRRDNASSAPGAPFADILLVKGDGWQGKKSEGNEDIPF